MDSTLTPTLAHHMLNGASPTKSTQGLNLAKGNDLVIIFVVLSSVDLDQGDPLCFNLITNEVLIDINMFSSSMKHNLISSQMYCTLAITMHTNQTQL